MTWGKRQTPARGAFMPEETPPPSGFHVETMTADERAVLIDWAAAEGWNPGLADLDIASAVDPDAFVALKRADELVGGGSIFRHGPGFGFMGLFIMRQDVRGQGLGARLWTWRLNRLKQRLGPGATIGMDGVFEMAPFYERGGFTPAYRHLRFQGAAHAGEGVDAGVVPIDASNLEAALALDDRLFPVPRHDFMRRWIAQPGASALAVPTGEGLAGLGVMRPCRRGFKIGPLYAEDAAVAERLFHALLGRAQGELVQIDVPEPNAAAVAMAARQGFEESFGCVRLYHGPDPGLDLRRIFATASLEFG